MIQVLIVEDDPMVADINTRYIRRLPGFQVVGTIGNGADSLAYLSSHPGIDLLILDVYMPKMDGLEMLEQLRRQFDKIDVIFVTAAREKRIIRRGLELGAVDYLIKPFTFERIQQALEKYRQRYEFFHCPATINQGEVDRLFDTSPKVSLPKGIHPLTLEKMRALTAHQPGPQLDLHAMAKELSVSLVTLRLYLDFLVEEQLLIKEQSYGTVGRPTYQYFKAAPERVP
ncbi:MAG: response regulator [Pseudoflavonifractor sp.]